MKTCLIISGGSLAQPPVKIEYDFCIACDRGYKNAEKMAILPDIILGDFDSAKGPKVSKSNSEKEPGTEEKNSGEFLGYENFLQSSITFDGRNIPTISFPKDKDDTDTMLAIKYAIREGYEKIILSCCLGGRFDHTMANIQSMAYAALHGCICELIDSSEWMRTITPKDGECRISKRENCSLSLFSLSDICGNLYISGAKYCVEGATLTNDFPLGHGNSWEEDEIKISVSSGILLLVESDVSEEGE